MAGQDPAMMRAYTLREVALIVEAAGLRDARLAWQSAQFARIAYHKPNDMPECPGSSPPPGTQSEADIVYVRAWMKAMHNRSRKQNGT